MDELQRILWIFTLNNYDKALNYKENLPKEESGCVGLRERGKKRSQTPIYTRIFAASEEPNIKFCPEFFFLERLVDACAVRSTTTGKLYWS